MQPSEVASSNCPQEKRHGDYHNRGLKNFSMKILVVICLGLLTDPAVGQKYLSVNAIPAPSADQTTTFSMFLQCESATYVYMAAISYTYNTTLCACPTRQSVGCEDSPSTISTVSSACWTSATCAVVFSNPIANCSNVKASILYLCAPVSPSLIINREGNATGILLTAGYSTPSASASSDSALWVCTVEASDCSSVGVMLHLVIRNGNETASYFSGSAETVSEQGVAMRYTNYRTFIGGAVDIVLVVVPNSALLNAYFTVTGEKPMTMTCGRKPTPVPTSSNNVSVVSTFPRSISGHELTAVHSSSGEERVGDWSCVVETADCSTATPVQLSFYIRNRPCRSPSYFLLYGRQVQSGSTVTVTTPLAVKLHLTEVSGVRLAYFSVTGKQNLTLTCGKPPDAIYQNFLRQCDYCRSSPCHEMATCVQTPDDFQCLCPAGFSSSSNGHSCVDNDECTRSPPPCDVTAHCNNTEGSFHCYCDPGYNLTDNGRGCTGPSFPVSPSQTSVVGPAVGAAVVITVVVVIVIVIVAIVRQKRTSKIAAARGRKARLAGSQSQRDNMAFSDTATRNGEQVQASPNYMTPIPHPHSMTSTSSAVMSQDDQHYCSMPDGEVPGDVYSELQEQASPDYLTPVPRFPSTTSGSSVVTSHADQQYNPVVEGDNPSDGYSELPTIPDYLTVIPDPPSITPPPQLSNDVTR